MKETKSRDDYENGQEKALKPRRREENRKEKKVIGAKPDIFFVQAPLINGGDTIRNKTLLQKLYFDLRRMLHASDKDRRSIHALSGERDAQLIFRIN